MPHRNPEFYKGPTFQEDLEKAIEEHTKLVNYRERKVYWKEPSKHDILYQRDEHGQKLFFPSSVPAEPGLGEPEPEDIADRINRQIQGRAMLQLARELGAETFEEANDFQVEEGQDLDPYSGHEYSEQDEADQNLAYANYVKQTEEQQAKEALAKRRQEYLDMKAAFEPPAPGDAAPSKDGDKE